MIKDIGLGADDYIIKPSLSIILITRVKTNLIQDERLQKTSNGAVTSENRVGNIRAQAGSRRVLVRDKEVKDVTKEFEPLLLLITNIDMVISKETLYERIWGYDEKVMMRQSRFTQVACARK